MIPRPVTYPERTVRCPRCGEPAGERCVNLTRGRAAWTAGPHRERWVAARES